MAHKSTLFHLVPKTPAASETLRESYNLGFVSESATGNQGLEVGFHVSGFNDCVITSLGRQGDLILRDEEVSRKHIAFEIHPETQSVLLSVRTTRPLSVSVRERICEANGQQEPGQLAEGNVDDCVLYYGTPYDITISASNLFVFDVVWAPGNQKDLRDLAVRDYHTSQSRLADRCLLGRSKKDPFSESLGCDTKMEVDGGQRIYENGDNQRFQIDRGAFGKVFRAVNRDTGVCFAVKVIDLKTYPNIQQARAKLSREVKILRSLKHVRHSQPSVSPKKAYLANLHRKKNIVECQGWQKFDIPEPEIFMPLLEGNLRSLKPFMARENCFRDRIADAVFEQMLSALDYLDFKKLCHRDVKPENILFCSTGDDYTFQLADFGLANRHDQATWVVGTIDYKAPELYPKYGKYAQSPKMDVWSLFATIADIHPRFDFPPRSYEYDDILESLRKVKLVEPIFRPMAVEDPTRRASAGQLLVKLFDARGLTTPRSEITDYVEKPTESAAETTFGDQTEPEDTTIYSPMSTSSSNAPNLPRVDRYRGINALRLRETDATPAWS